VQFMTFVIGNARILVQAVDVCVITEVALPPRISSAQARWLGWARPGGTCLPWRNAAARFRAARRPSA